MASKYSEDEQFEAYIKKTIGKKEKKELIKNLEQIIQFLKRNT